MSVSKAWIVDFGGGFTAAVGELEMIHLVEHPKVNRGATATDNCYMTITWQDKQLPLIDMNEITNNKSVTTSLVPLVGVFVFVEEGCESPRFSAIVLESIPVRCMVDDTQACPLPDDLIHCKYYFASCFSYEGKSIPVLNLVSLFSNENSSLLEDDLKQAIN